MLLVINKGYGFFFLFIKVLFRDSFFFVCGRCSSMGKGEKNFYLLLCVRFYNRYKCFIKVL